MAETGQRVGDYEVIAPLGVGGMGRVYKVRNVISNREEAMKILLPDFASDPDLAARFMAEIRTLAGLEHPGIAQLRTAFQYNNQFVMVMEFVEGTTLEKLASQVRIPLNHILDFSMQVLAALSYAHGKGVTHRDIKPANIMITTHGVIKLMDFGIAKSTGDMQLTQLTRPGSTMGSVYYMSPEQVRGGTVDGRSDLYSYGVTLYEMLTGRKPFQADTSYSVLNAQVNEPPRPPIEVNPEIPAALNEIVLRAMAKNPEERFQTAEEFRGALRGVSERQSAAMPAVASEPGLFEPVTPGGSTQAMGDASQAPYEAPQPPPFMPVPGATGPLIAPASPRRGLWIGLGAATAILALVAVAWVLPRVFSTHANPKTQAAATTEVQALPAVTPGSSAQPQAPAITEPTTTPSTPPAAVSTASSPEPNATAPRHVAPTHAPGGASASSGSAEQRPAYVPPASQATGNAAAVDGGTQPAGPSPREMRDARDRYANLEARADAALSGVDEIRNQQRAQGLDIRGDILAGMNRLHHQLDMARQALGTKDLETANEYMSRADEETARLEKFLGR